MSSPTYKYDYYVEASNFKKKNIGFEMFVFYSFKQEELQQRKNQTTPKIHEMQMKEYERKTNNLQIEKLKYNKFN